MSKNQSCKIWDTPASGEIENHLPPNYRSDGSYLDSPAQVASISLLDCVKVR